MKEFLCGVVAGLIGIVAGAFLTEHDIIQNCIKANADMPYSKVEGYCKDKLKSLQGKE